MRVRKMARELDRSPEDLLLLLKDLGHSRFRSGDDMLSDDVAEQLRKAARARPPQARLPTPRSRPAAQASAASPSGGDLMASLVPGVTKTGAPAARPKSAPPRAPERTPPSRAPAAQLPSAEEGAGALLAAERERLAAERSAIDARAAELDARAATLDLRAAALDARELALEARSQSLAEPLYDRGSALSLLEERGLRGQDEAERAIAALASRHLLGGVLGALYPKDKASFARLLSERLVLVGGAIPDGLDAPAVTVSPERADLPGGQTLTKLTNRVGEHLLLAGIRRVLLVGIPPKWHALLKESIDRRVELIFRASLREEDSARNELVVGWNTELGLREEERKQRKTLSISAPTVGEFLEHWALLLRSDSDSDNS